MSERLQTDRLGVATLARFFSEHGWLFREQFSSDFGIDAQVEVVKNREATGKLVAIQIKSGASYFSEETKASFVFRVDDKHIRYWVRHSLPVMVVLYNPDTDTLYWEHVSKATAKSTGSGWKIEVPKTKTLTDNSLRELERLTQPPPYIRRLNKLRLDRRWMDLVEQGETVYVEFEDWVNKTLPRFAVRIGCDSRSDVEDHLWPTAYGPGLSFEDLLSYLVPWADFAVDEEAYCTFMESQWEADCYGSHDKESGETYYSSSFEDYYKPPEGIVPVGSNGETESYRLILSLNQVGQAFITLDEYLGDDDDLKGRIFTLDP